MDNEKTPPSVAFPQKSDRSFGTILVVDSDADMMQYLATLLKRFDYNAVMASSGQEARVIMSDVLPALIITGVTVDHRSGNEFMKELRQDPVAAKIPFISILRPDDPAESRQAYDLGALECLYHPITPERLYRMVQKHIEEAPRTYLRIRTALPVKILSSAENTDVVTTTIISISELGMFVRMEEPYDVNTRLTCRIDLKGQKIIADVKVIYTFRGEEGPFGEPGMGLEFVTLHGQGWVIVRQFIRDEISSGARLA